jgi:hypothetical protein
MPTLLDLKAKYGLGDGAKHEPFADCKFCRGTGEKTTKAGNVAFCICLFVDHDLSNFAGESLGKVATKLREEMEGR